MKKEKTKNNKKRRVAMGEDDVKTKLKKAKRPMMHVKCLGWFVRLSTAFAKPYVLNCGEFS